ncbi:MAG: hypothetical protein IT561_27055 [Alphaproteobacteria bacterium]|nr:hypothetical protein [Alphaproteobacteria bacterium]
MAPPGRFHPLVAAAFDQVPFDGQPRCYFLATAHRCGSHLLADLLTATGEMGVPAEYFNIFHVAEPMARRLDLGYPLGVERYLEAVIRLRTTPNGVFGAKAHGDQIRHFLPAPATRRLLARSRFVRLRRRDAVAQAISFDLALQTNAWLETRQSVDRSRPRLDTTFIAWRIDRLLARIAAADQLWDNLFDANGVTPLELWYEDLLADPDTACRAVCALVGVKPRERFELSQSRFLRQDDPQKAEWRERYLASLRC